MIFGVVWNRGTLRGKLVTIFSDKPIWWVTNYLILAAIFEIGLMNIPIIIGFWDVHRVRIDLQKIDGLALPRTICVTHLRASWPGSQHRRWSAGLATEGWCSCEEGEKTGQVASICGYPISTGSGPHVRGFISITRPWFASPMGWSWCWGLRRKCIQMMSFLGTFRYRQSAIFPCCGAAWGQFAEGLGRCCSKPLKTKDRPSWRTPHDGHGYHNLPRNPEELLRVRLPPSKATSSAAPRRNFRSKNGSLYITNHKIPTKWRWDQQGTLTGINMWNDGELSHLPFWSGKQIPWHDVLWWFVRNFFFHSIAKAFKLIPNCLIVGGLTGLTPPTSLGFRAGWPTWKLPVPTPNVGLGARISPYSSSNFVEKWYLTCTMVQKPGYFCILVFPQVRGQSSPPMYPARV